MQTRPILPSWPDQVPNEGGTANLTGVPLGDTEQDKVMRSSHGVHRDHRVKQMLSPSISPYSLPFSSVISVPSVAQNALEFTRRRSLNRRGRLVRVMSKSPAIRRAFSLPRVRWRFEWILTARIGATSRIAPRLLPILHVLPVLLHVLLVFLSLLSGGATSHCNDEDQ